MEDDKTFLADKISEYYDSIKGMFLYRVKNSWKRATILISFAITSIFLIFNIIPTIPLKLHENYYSMIYNLINQHSNSGVSELSFYFNWAIDCLISFILCGITLLLAVYYTMRFNKRALGDEYLSFYYAFSLKKNLKSYLINGNSIYDTTNIRFFNKLAEQINTFKVSDQLSLTIQKLYNEIRKQHNWIEFTPETINIVNSISSINDKIFQRIKSKKNIDKILPLIDLLVLYEFSIIKPEIINSKGIKLEEKQVDYFKEFIEELNKTDSVEHLFVIKERERLRTKSIFAMINNFLYSPNILILFFCWLLLLVFVFIPVSSLIISLLNIKLDSTIMIGLLTTPFLGAITFAGIIYSKTKK